MSSRGRGRGRGRTPGSADLGPASICITKLRGRGGRGSGAGRPDPLGTPRSVRGCGRGRPPKAGAHSLAGRSPAEPHHPQRVPRSDDDAGGDSPAGVLSEAQGAGAGSSSFTPLAKHHVKCLQTQVLQLSLASSRDLQLSLSAAGGSEICRDSAPETADEAECPPASAQLPGDCLEHMAISSQPNVLVRALRMPLTRLARFPLEHKHQRSLLAALHTSGWHAQRQEARGCSTHHSSARTSGHSCQGPGRDRPSRQLPGTNYLYVCTAGISHELHPNELH